MRQDKKLAAACNDAAKYLRKCADVLDKIAEGDANEGEGQKQPKKRRICD